MKTLTIYCPNGKAWFIRIRNERNGKIVAMHEALKFIGVAAP